MDIKKKNIYNHRLTNAPAGVHVCPGGKLFGRLVQRPAHGLHMNGSQQSLSSEHCNKSQSLIFTWIFRF